MENNNYLLDSNIFFIDYNFKNKLAGKNIYLCDTVLEELDKHKTDAGISGYNVRKSIKKIELDNDINYVLGYEDIKLDMSIPDNKIIGAAKKYNLNIITNDVSMRVKCKLIGVSAEKYSEVIEEVGNVRKGIHYLDSSEILSKLYEVGYMEKTDDMYENDFVLFKSNDKVIQICQVKNGKIRQANTTKQKPRDFDYRNLEQSILGTLIYENDLNIISITGTMGVGKNFCSMAVSLDLIDRKKYDKLFICKSPVPLDKEFSLGFRPGGWLEDKVLPTLASFTSNLNNLKADSDNKKVNGKSILLDMIEFGIIEVVDLEYIQGVSLPPKSIIIFDEFQTVEAKKNGRALLSRVGEDSLVICLGDLKQSNGSKHTIEDSALYHLIESFSGYEKYAHIELSEVVRSEFVKELDKRW